jgi:Cu/Ag efflux pump CusA
MERVINTLSKNLSTWGRRALVQTSDGFASLKGIALDNGNVLLSKARIAFSDASSTTLRAIQSGLGGRR